MNGRVNPSNRQSTATAQPIHAAAGVTRWVRRTAAPLLLASCALALGCGAANTPPRADMRELDERRALLVIQNSIADHHARPGPNKDVPLGDKQLTVDVTVEGTPYGVAFITAREAQQLGKALPNRQASDELRLVRPTPDDIVLVLYQDVYQYDVSDKHTVTAQTAELKLRKDVGDFVLRVVKAGKTR